MTAGWRGIGMLGGSGLLASYGIGCLLAAAILALALAVPAWLAALIVAAAVFAVSAVIALLGKGKLSKATPVVPEHAAQSVKADVEEIKESAHR
jgi:hypothetical protein